MVTNKSNQTVRLFSIIIAVYERHDELRELLNSLVQQTCSEFEVIIVDDGSKHPLDTVIESYRQSLDIHYYFKSNSGPGLTRNYGMSKATGDYFIFLDSDTILPVNYLCDVRDELQNNYVDFYGGSDAARQDFNDLQKAINYSMTSLLTTGGIRGGKDKVGKFQPRSFNMGLSRTAYEATGRFSDLRIGEDPDLTMRLWEKGYKSRWFPRASVYHKRRASISSFSNQVYQFGIARPILNQRHPSHTSITFWFPSLFFIGLCTAFILFLFGMIWPLALYGIYYLGILISSSFINKSIRVGFLSIITTTVQFVYYGIGFLTSQCKLKILGQKPEEAFPNHYYQNK